MPVAASAIYYLNLHGDVLINRLYCDDVGSLSRLCLHRRRVRQLCSDSSSVLDTGELGRPLLRGVQWRIDLGILPSSSSIDDLCRVTTDSRRSGGLPCKLEGIVESPLVNGYRNKCEFSVGYSVQGKPTAGFMLGNFRQLLKKLRTAKMFPHCTLHFDDELVNSEFERMAQAFAVGPSADSPLPLTSLVVQCASWDEENWRAQYGQVIRSGEESVPDFKVIDLWDWSIVTRTRKDGKNQVARLVGRLVRQSARLHPSMPSGGGLLKTAPICEVHLDLVRVTSGQVYKLRSPSAKYLASLSTYDSSNPTKDWGFPELSIDGKIQAPPGSGGNCEVKMIKGAPVQKDLPSLPGQLCASNNDVYMYFRGSGKAAELKREAAKRTMMAALP
ncbi:unnamed protein product [Camellia sinensis]